MNRNAFWTVIWVLTTVFIFGQPARGQSVETVDFEDHPTNPTGASWMNLDPGFYAERGIHFEDGTVVEYEEGFATSGSHGLEVCFSTEFDCTTPFRVGFDSRQRTVAVSVGYSGALDEPTPVFMVAFDENGGRLTDDETFLGPGSPVPVGPQLVVEDPEGRIAAVEVRWRDATRDTRSLVIDDLAVEPLLPFIEFISEPTQLDIESVAEPAEIVITNIGNATASLSGVDFDEGNEAFELVETTCDGRLPPGESCVIVVGFNPPDAGDYTTAAVLFDPNGEGVYAVPIIGRLAVAETPPTTASPPTSAVPLTETPTVVPPTAVPDDVTEDAGSVPQTSSEGGLDADLLLIVIVLVAIGGTGLLVRLWPGRVSSRASARTTPVGATVRVIPDRGSNSLTTDDRQAVTAIRIADHDSTTTTLIEEERT